MHYLYTILLSTLKKHTHMAHISKSRDMHHLLLIGSITHHLDQETHTTCSWLGPHKISFRHINTLTIISQFKPQIKCFCIITWLNLLQEDPSSWMLLSTDHLLVNIPYGMPQLQFYSFGQQIWTLSSATDRVYTAFFYSDSAQHLQHIEEKVLFGHFVTRLNDAFEHAFTSEDIECESGSKSMSVPTPLHQEPMTISHFHARKFIKECRLLILFDIH